MSATYRGRVGAKASRLRKVYTYSYNVFFNLIIIMQAASVTEKGTARSGHQTDILVENSSIKGMVSTALESAYLIYVMNTCMGNAENKINCTKNQSMHVAK